MTFRLAAWSALAFVFASMSASTQPPPSKDKGKGPPVFVIPPFAVDQLELSPEQDRQIQELERDLRRKVAEILTPEQWRKLGTIRTPHEGGERRVEKKAPVPHDEPRPETPKRETSTGPIPWFATWDDARAEAKKTARPILLVSAAPHCAGVSGIW